MLTDRQKLALVLHEMGHLKALIEEAMSTSSSAWNFAEDLALNPAFHKEEAVEKSTTQG